MRGDRPYYLQVGQAVKKFTPHARGSTYCSDSPGEEQEVYPACAGIDPNTSISLAKSRSLPRMRGDRPLLHRGQYVADAFTPHARGSTVPDELCWLCGGVY